MNFNISRHGGDRRCRDKRAFTMVEMLTVLAIVALLLFIGLPVFQSFSARGTASTASGVGTTLRLARQMAVTKRTSVWVVFPDGRGTYAIRPEIQKAAISYAVIASNRENGRLEYMSEWKFLPKGVTFLTNTTFMNGYTVFNSYSDVAASDRATTFPFPTDGSSSQNLSAVLFRPNGQGYMYSRPSKRWTLSGSVQNPNNYTIIPITSARYIEVNTNTGVVVRYNDVAGVTNHVVLYNQTGQFRVREW